MTVINKINDIFNEINGKKGNYNNISKEITVDTNDIHYHLMKAVKMFNSFLIDLGLT